jgi:hypothetical protein
VAYAAGTTRGKAAAPYLAARSSYQRVEARSQGASAVVHFAITRLLVA